jgi:hypothetical protein
LTEDAADFVEVHRRQGAIQADSMEMLPPVEFVPGEYPSVGIWPGIVRIALRGPEVGLVRQEDVLLEAGDVVVVPSRRHEVFYVVGRLSPTNTVRFTIGDRERELGVGFVLPRDREIDVVTAVTMAGYIDPIESPTTVTVHRVMHDGRPMLIHVDLIKARYDERETVLVQAGDIIYLNPDAPWWMRHQFERIVPDLLLLPYARWMDNLIPARTVR